MGSRVYVLVGLPSSGKTTWAKTFLANQEDKKFYHSYHLESDDIRKQLFGTLNEDIQTKEHHTKVFAEMNNRLLSLVSKYKNSKVHASIIYDATNLNRRKRRGLYNNIKQTDSSTEVILVMFQYRLQKLIDLNKKRVPEKQVSEDVLRRMYISMQPPRLTVDCDMYNLLGERFFNYLSDPLLSGVEPTEEFKEEIIGFYTNEPHDNPHHAETIREHINLCVKNSGEDNVMQTVSLYHDLGKFIAKRWDDRGFYTYIGHANVSAMYYLNLSWYKGRLRPDRGYDNTIMEIIFQHMNAHQGGIGVNNIRNNKIDDKMLKALEKFAKIDEKSKISRS